MKFIVTQKNILEGVGRVSSLAGRNPQLPILQNILIEVKDGVMHLTCTDLEVGAHVLVAGKAEEDGKCVAPARKLLEYVQQLPSTEPVVFQLEKENLKVSTKKFNAGFQTASTEDFPLLPMPEKEQGIELNGRLFCRAVSNTLFSAARDETRPELHSVFVSAQNNKLSLAATDSFRLSEQVIPIESNEKFSFLLPVNAAQEVVRLFSSSDDMKLLVEKNYVAFKNDNCDLSTRLVDGNYPDYQQIIPTKFSTNVVIDSNEALRALKTMSVFLPRDLRRVSANVKPEQGSIGFNVEGGEGGHGEVEVDMEGKGDDVKLLFNIQYLMEGFQHIPGDKCEILLGGESDPLLMRPCNNSIEQLYVVMPIQL